MHQRVTHAKKIRFTKANCYYYTHMIYILATKNTEGCKIRTAISRIGSNSYI